MCIHSSLVAMATAIKSSDWPAHCPAQSEVECSLLPRAAWARAASPLEGSCPLGVHILKIAL